MLKVTPALVCLVGLALVVMAGDETADTCAVEDRTAPTALSGGYGGKSDDYWFRHRSDVERETPKPERGGEGEESELRDTPAFHRDKLNRFIHTLHNDHKERILYATWKRAGIEGVRVLPGDCFRRTFETTCDAVEDSKATIEFGVSLSKKTGAATYVVTGEPAPVPDNAAPLRSTFFGTLAVGSENRKVEIDLTFTCSRAGKGWRYAFENRGRPVRIKAPDLVAIATVKGLAVESAWSIVNETRIASSAESKAFLAFRVEEARVGLAERSVSIDVEDEDFQPLFTGTLVAYIPVPR